MRKRARIQDPPKPTVTDTHTPAAGHLALPPPCSMLLRISALLPCSAGYMRIRYNR